jgi:hypothetical protein
VPLIYPEFKGVVTFSDVLTPYGGTIMTDSKKHGKSDSGSKTSDARSAAEDVRQAFAGLPLDQKVSTLIQVELDMLGDAVNSVVGAVSKVVDDLAKACEPSAQPSSSTSSSTGSTSA